MATIGLLHPGAMGLCVGLTLKNSGHEVLWASDGRSAKTRDRAEEIGLSDCRSIDDMAVRCSAIVSVCPPEFASFLADHVWGAGFRGLYIDANATAPNSKEQSARRMEAAGARFVDGGIIGLPARERGRTWLYLSGPHAPEAASFFTAGPMEVEAIGAEVGQASALKMCFAAWSKGSTALLAATFAAAQQMDVFDQLKNAWSRIGMDFGKAERDIVRSAPKAWRFAGEMKEIAHTFEFAGAPGGFHRAAEEIYERLRGLKDREGLTPDEVWNELKAKERAAAPGVSGTNAR
jgi:3-hydroxyisobutyrate dehydrogenase-like beta-hydroxyacid dehydrogenase